MIQKLKKLLSRSEFAKNTLILIIGTSFAQLLPLIFTPILSRLFTPKQFGLLSIFMTLSILFGNIVGGKYEMSILILPRKVDTYNMLSLGFLLTVFNAAILLIIAIVFAGPISTLFKAPNLGKVLWIMPFGIIGLSMFNFFNFYFTREKKYTLISSAKITRGSTTALAQTGAGLLKYSFGLVVGYVSGLIAGIIPFTIKFFKSQRHFFRSLSLKHIKKLAIRYKKFPIFNIPSTLANRLSTDITNIVVSPLFGLKSLGLYFQAYRFMSVPSYFIGLSLSQVYMQTASDELKKHGTVHKTFFSVLKKLVIIAIPTFLIIFLIAKPAFTFILGKRWYMSGVYAQIITPLLFTRFIASPLSSTLYIIEKQETILIYQIFLLLTSVGSFLFGHMLKLNFSKTLIILSFSNSLVYIGMLLILVYYVLRLKKHPRTKTA